MPDGTVEAKWNQISAGSKALLVAANSLADRDAVWIITTNEFADGSGNIIAKFTDQGWIEDKS